MSDGPVLSPIPAHRSKLSPQQFTAYVNRVSNTIQGANPQQRANGERLFDQINAQAQYMGRNNGGLHKAAGIIAATSISTGWDQNIAAAGHILGTHPSDSREDEKFHPLAVQTDKARRIQEGEDPMDVLKGQKERSFYQNITDPSNPHVVTVDRHAHDAAAGVRLGEARRGLRSTGRYGIISDVYRHAAARHGLIGSQAQSIAWLHQTGRDHIASPDTSRRQW